MFFNADLRRKVKDLEHDVRQLRIEVYCLRGIHEWIVQDMVILCKHCRKHAEKMPDNSKTQLKGLGS